MAYFAQFLKPPTVSIKANTDPAAEFDASWYAVKSTLEFPDERQLARGITSTNVVEHLNAMVNLLIYESSEGDEGSAGGCMEYLLKNDVLGTLVRLSEIDRPFGIQAEVLRVITKLVSALDERFLVHSAVHKAVIRLLRTSVGEELDHVDGARPMGAASISVRAEPSDYEYELAELLCTLCNRIRSYRDLLLIFLHDKNWYQPSSLPAMYDDGEEEEAVSASDISQSVFELQGSQGRSISPTPSAGSVSTITTARQTVASAKKAEYEFLIFNYLLRFVHREGRIGDLARGGILSLVTVAMYSGDNNTGETQTPTASFLRTDGISVDPVAEAALALAEYILDGDFPQVLCAGIGAVYSALPTKLTIRWKSPTSDNGGGMTLGGAIDQDGGADPGLGLDDEVIPGAVDSTDPSFMSLLKHFLHLLEFMQDLLIQITLVASSSELDTEYTSPSSLVALTLSHTVLDTFRTTFLKNSERNVSDLIIVFLMSKDDDTGDTLHSNTVARAERERRSRKKKNRKTTALVLLEHHQQQRLVSQQHYDILTTSLGRFTLKDLLIDNIQSANRHSACTALRLLRSLCTDHCHLTSTIDGLGLFIVNSQEDATNFQARHQASTSGPAMDLVREEDESEEFVYPGVTPEETKKVKPLLYAPFEKENFITSSEHAREIELYDRLISRIVPADSNMSDSLLGMSSSVSYSNYLGDAVTLVSRTPCYTLPTSSVADPPPVRQYSLSLPHRLSPLDALLQTLLQSLRLFFVNSPQINVELTGVLSAICACPYRDMGGWLSMGVNDDAWGDVDWEGKGVMGRPEDDEDEREGDDRSIDFRIDILLRSGVKTALSPLRPKPRTVMPVLYSVLSGLVSQLDRYRRSVTDFDKFLEERRQGLLFFTDNITDAINLNMIMAADEQALGRSGTKRGDGRNATAAVPTPPPNTPARSNVLAKGFASLTGIFSPSSRKSSIKSIPPSTPAKSKSAPIVPQTPEYSGSTSRDFPTSPFTPHYKHTRGITVEGIVAPAPTEGPWSPQSRTTKAKTKAPEYNPFAPSSLDFSYGLSNEASFEDVFTAPASRSPDVNEANGIAPLDPEQALAKRASAARLNLSQLLDNVVVLEESVKELAAILQVRRSLGIDALVYA
ncbi:Retinoic acid induced 16-like protein-domain-containing protein [Cantharellus anzutake]|uniref:Retinoic acid induced 16-like protein-domain-containing protein n=1 Tax=Cantharellus anzutake TaxID=1750568 RepID=UPI001906A5C5|nr:Retinoic acid induced 16-like protein-domain-containing protein [Cantharellus anzutake]KAF8329156.1 Retinoic acid induced 16-like protein-domain-containing protein [Cantharellus anzutake]